MTQRENRVTLSDGSVWEKMDGANIWMCTEGRYVGYSGDVPWPGDHLHLTASDHRAIADVIDRLTPAGAGNGE